MRRARVVGSFLGAVVVAASGCATSSGAFSSSQSASMRQPSSGRFDFAAFRDSVRAQEIADREGPGVSIHAEVTSFASSRRVRTTFRMEDDGYVLVGHLGPDGILRIVFPTSPSDNGFVQGGKSYRLPEFHAGFADMYRWRNANYSTLRTSSSRLDSYDGGAGFVFVIAAWRPMRFERFSDNGQWDAFEVADEVYTRDPRPAVYELATLLTGENREAYTVKFASYFSSLNSYGRSAFASGYCMGYEPMGYGVFGDDEVFGRGMFYPRGVFNNYYSGYFTYGSTPYTYRYDSGQNCYRAYPVSRQSYASSFVPPRFVPTDTSAGNQPVSPRRNLPANLPPRLRQNPIRVNDAPSASEPEYRRRGLVTEEETDRQPRRARENPGASGSAYQPPIQQMVNRRRESIDRGRNESEGSRPSTPRSAGVNGRSDAGRDYSGADRTRREPVRTERSNPSYEPSRRAAEPAPTVTRPEPRSEPVRVDPPRPPESRPTVESRPAEGRPAESRPPVEPPVIRPRD